jgi:3-deoxy-D-manno-octulosonate 8-phosphate phosphatase (KDO 8-P phosphatase)
VFIDENGVQSRRFNIKDGLGLKRVIQNGVRVVIMSSSTVEIVRFRAEVLGIEDVFVGVKDKLSLLRQISGGVGIASAEIAFMGDDLTDLDTLRFVGLPCAPADAVPAVRDAARLVTTLPGGHGAVRELCDLIVDAQTGPTT